MTLRKASAYSKKKITPYTRKSRAKEKAYIKTIPQLKISKFNMGDMKSYTDKKHPFIVRLIAEERVLIRDNALEACRMFINKTMDVNAQGQYYFSVRVYPHHILRENKTAAVAGADRMSTGMTHSFGVVVGRAAIVYPGREIFFISCTNEKSAKIARNALSDIKAKIPCRSRIVFEKI